MNITSKDLLVKLSRLHHLANIALDINTDQETRDLALIKIVGETESHISDHYPEFEDKELNTELEIALPELIQKELEAEL